MRNLVGNTNLNKMLDRSKDWWWTRPIICCLRRRFRSCCELRQYLLIRTVLVRTLNLGKRCASLVRWSCLNSQRTHSFSWRRQSPIVELRLSWGSINFRTSFRPQSSKKFRCGLHFHQRWLHGGRHWRTSIHFKTDNHYAWRCDDACYTYLRKQKHCCDARNAQYDWLNSICGLDLAR